MLLLLLLGHTGYVGTAFSQLFDAQDVPYRGISRRDVDYTDRSALIDLIRDTEPTFLINAAGYTGKPNVDACEYHKADCLQGNAVLPGIIREACEATELPWGHVSSGCIYTGARPDGSGFTEDDPPNFCFRTNNCSFYSGSKALGEECLQGAEQTYIWRLRIPFDHIDSSRNYISKLLRYKRLLEATNSISHLDEFVAACWQCWQRRVPYGTYNVTNTGSITTSRVTELIKQHLPVERNSFRYQAPGTGRMSGERRAASGEKNNTSPLAPGTGERVRVRGQEAPRHSPLATRNSGEAGTNNHAPRTFDFFASEAEFMQLAANTPRSNCIMDNTKLLATGIEMSSVEEAVERALRNWKWEEKVMVEG